jgi:hypothetical protein
MMLRRLLGAVAFASTLISLISPVAMAEAPRLSAMQFSLRMEGPDSACGNRCRLLVSASGMIRADSAADFEAFAEKNDLKGATVVLESEGGSVLGAMALGRAIRRLGLSTTVGRVLDLPSGTARATVSPDADCESMCAFVLLAGVTRMVPPEARVRVHQIWLGDRREDAAAAVYSAEDLVLVQRDIGRLAQYTMEMGGGVDLLEVSLRIPPWEPMRTLTRNELRRMRLDITETAQAPAPPQPAASAAPQASEASGAPAPANVSVSARKISLGDSERGWTTVEQDGAMGLLRSHPLTVEGEEIGIFGVTIACTPNANELAVLYKETRRVVSVDKSDLLRKIDIRIGHKTARLAVQSSEWNSDRSRLDTTARGVVPISMVRPLAEFGSHSLTVTTADVSKATTTIRVGNTGLASKFLQFTKSCGARGKTAHAGLRVEANAAAKK